MTDDQQSIKHLYAIKTYVFSIAAQRRVSVPVCAHTRTSDFGGPSDGGHTGLPNFRWWYPVCFANLAVCHPKQENPPFLHCSYFIETNIYSHFFAFSSYF